MARRLIQLKNLAQQGTCRVARATRNGRFSARDRRSNMSPDRRRVRVLAADGHPLYRDALTRAIKERPELELVGQARDGREALDAIGSERPDVAVLDRTLSGLSGEQILNAVGRDGLATRVVMLAAEPDPGLVYAAIANGAAGYLTKDADARELCDAISAVARGRTVLSPQLQAGIAGRDPPEGRRRAPLPERPRARDPEAGRERADGSPDRPQPASQHRHREDPSAARLREARRGRARGGRRGGYAPRPGGVTFLTTPARRRRCGAPRR